MYFEIQRILSLVSEAAAPRPSRFDPLPRLAHELRRLLAVVPESAIPEDLRAAVLSGAIVGDAAAEWLPRVRQWLADECARSGV